MSFGALAGPSMDLEAPQRWSRHLPNCLLRVQRACLGLEPVCVLVHPWAGAREYSCQVGSWGWDRRRRRRRAGALMSFVMHKTWLYDIAPCNAGGWRGILDWACSTAAYRPSRSAFRLISDAGCNNAEKGKNDPARPKMRSSAQSSAWTPMGIASLASFAGRACVHVPPWLCIAPPAQLISESICQCAHRQSTRGHGRGRMRQTRPRELLACG